MLLWEVCAQLLSVALHAPCVGASTPAKIGTGGFRTLPCQKMVVDFEEQAKSRKAAFSWPCALDHALKQASA